MRDLLIMMGICPRCKEHCEFIKEDEYGEAVYQDDPTYKDNETEVMSECCGELE